MQLRKHKIDNVNFEFCVPMEFFLLCLNEQGKDIKENEVEETQRLKYKP